MVKYTRAFLATLFLGLVANMVPYQNYVSDHVWYLFVGWNSAYVYMRMMGYKL